MKHTDESWFISERFHAGSKENETIITEVDLNRSEKVRRWWPFLRDRRIDEYADILKRFAQ